MHRAAVYVIGFTPPVVVLAGLPLANTTKPVLGLPLLALWIVMGIVLTSACLFMAARLLEGNEENEGGRG